MGGRGGASGFKKDGKSAKLLNAADFPKLSGSEKQVKWAEDIREKAIEAVNSSLKFREERLKENPGISIYKDDMEAAKKISSTINTVLSQVDSASKIIEMRDLLKGSRIKSEINELSYQLSNKRMKK